MSKQEIGQNHIVNTARISSTNTLNSGPLQVKSQCFVGLWSVALLSSSRCVSDCSIKVPHCTSFKRMINYVHKVLSHSGAGRLWVFGKIFFHCEMGESFGVLCVCFRASRCAWAPYCDWEHSNHNGWRHCAGLAGSSNETLLSLQY